MISKKDKLLILIILIFSFSIVYYKALAYPVEGPEAPDGPPPGYDGTPDYSPPSPSGGGDDDDDEASGGGGGPDRCSYTFCCGDPNTGPGDVCDSYCCVHYDCGVGCSSGGNCQITSGACSGGSGCSPSCGSKECGNDGCGGSCGSCEGYYLMDDVCSGGECQYYTADLTASQTDICLNNSPSSYQFTISGDNNYCGNVTTIILPWTTRTVVDNSYQPYSFQESFTIPIGHDPNNVDVTITGNREQIKGSKDDLDYTSDCTVTFTLVVEHDNFFYCPKPGESFNPDFDFYQDSSYFQFYGGDTEYPWDECTSDQTIQSCSPQPTDCVVIDGTSVSKDTASDGDQDTEEYEVCYSQNNIQGGWLDADVNQAACDIINDVRDAKWYDCSPTQECEKGVDSFDSDISTGLCCGDETSEFVSETKTLLEGNYIQNDLGQPKTYSACCDSSNSCVDESGVCRSVGYDSCISGGDYRAKCIIDNGEAVWNLTEDSSCDSICEECDVNDDNLVDQIDSNTITSNFCSSDGNPCYDSTFDINNDGVVDQADILLCKPLVEQGAVCFGCRDGTLQDSESCEQTESGLQFNCPSQTCDGAVTKTRVETCTGVCSCEYTSSCVVGQCGAECSEDSECGENEECNGCVCETVDPTKLGCVEENGVCEEGEGCACSDCHEKQDGCEQGLVCNYYTEECGEPCEVTEEPETTIDDGIDNDCDGLVDEPPFYPEYGAYIWEANCQYYLCTNALDSEPHTTKGLISVEGEYYINNVKTNYWEDSDLLNIDTNEVEFTSYITNDQDCILFESNTLMSFDLDMNGSHSTDNVYLTQERINPLENPFGFSAPECTSSCQAPQDCGTVIGVGEIGVRVDCGYEQCLFDCGGYWEDKNHILGDLFTPDRNPGDICLTCDEDTQCSDYNNEPSCVFNTCNAGGYFGCEWNQSSETCEQVFSPCEPGTTLCQDGTCSADCEETDSGNQGCINDNDQCDPGEGCACSDCEGEQDSCTDGAICGDDEICGCPSGTTLCQDGTCSEDCEETDAGNQGCIDENGVCEVGEGCACSDCDGYQDSCASGSVCSYYYQTCYELNVFGCPEGTTLCNDHTCDETCEDKGGKTACVGEPNNECEPGEGCACSDCNNKRDSCAEGLLCNYEYELCESVPGSGGGSIQSCEDDDNDGYYAIDSACFGSDDCNDQNSAVHPGTIEICNDLDDDCDGDIDESCISEGEDSLDLTISSTSGRARVLDKFELDVTVTNKLERQVSDVIVTLDVPSDFAVKDNSVRISGLSGSESEEVTFDVIVKDYTEEIAELTLNAKVSDSNVITERFNIDVEIPEFLIAPMPMFEYPNTDQVCLDYYYVLNSPDFDVVDIEFEIINPEAFFGKSYLVDYVSSVGSGDIVVEPLLSNPYCVSGNKNYKVNGYLYKPGVFFVDKVEESSEDLILR